MEEDASHYGFEIKDSRVPILLSLKTLSWLRPHEETVSKELGVIVKNLSHDTVLRHPLIADQSTGVVLDGTHRLAALKALGCYWAPCALVKYADPRILVDRWYRIITGSSSDGFAKNLGVESSHVESGLEGEQCLLRRECYASLDDGRSCLVLPCKGMGPVQITRAAFHLETVARETGLKVKYSDNKGTSSSPRRFVLSTIRLEKEEIVKSAVGGVVFPPKTTRHIIPSRPLGIATPLEWLRKEQPEQVQRRFVEDLKSKRVTRLPEGSKVGSRRYMEEVFVFN